MFRENAGNNKNETLNQLAEGSSPFVFEPLFNRQLQINNRQSYMTRRSKQDKQAIQNNRR